MDDEQTTVFGCLHDSRGHLAVDDRYLTGTFTFVDGRQDILFGVDTEVDGQSARHYDVQIFVTVVR